MNFQRLWQRDPERRNRGGRDSGRTGTGRARVPLVPLRRSRDEGFSRWGPRVEFESRKRGAIPVLGRIANHPALHGILMNVISMMREIKFVANPMIGKSALPNLALSSNDSAEFVRVRAFDQLNRPLDGYVDRGRQQEMYMLGHQNERMQFVPPVAAMTKKSSQENSDVRFDHEQSAAFPSHKSDEVSSRRRDKSRLLQSKPQRLKAASTFELKLARVELVPFPMIFCAELSF